jgi:lipopolysaccharide assembly outer membrane protein LptD (OstA)
LTLKKISHTVTKIVLKPLRTNLFHIVLLAIFLTAWTTDIHAQEIPRKKAVPTAVKKKPADNQQNLKPTVADTIAIDSTQIADVVSPQDSVKKKKTGLDAIVKRSAQDYEKLDQRKKQLTLYNKAELYYKDIELKAGIITMDYEKDEVHAGRIKDSLGKYTQYPYFKQGTNVVEADSIHFNTKTKKARVWNSRSDQGEFRIKAEITKRESDSVVFMKTARFTTSKDIENPEYYFETDRLKLVPGKKVVVGTTHMVIANVPTPLGLPFAFFPMSTKAESGILIPSYGDSNDRGYYLQNIGYYFALSDNYDLAVTGDYYTNGSYGLRFASSYAKRYSFNGNVNIRYENLITSERGLPDYTKTITFNGRTARMLKLTQTRDFRQRLILVQVNISGSRKIRQTLVQG